jgi:hypothetical protein
MNISATDILYEILESTSVEEMSLFSYQSSRSVQSKVDMHIKDTAALFDQAIEMKSSCGMPFWDSLMATTFAITDFDEKVFTEALVHSENDFYTKLDRDTIHSFVPQLNSLDINLAVASTVKMRNNMEMNICMIDFHIPFSSKGTYLVKRLLETLHQPGYLLCSGKSYHFYGKNLMSKNEYTDFLTKLILLSPIVDKNWIVHQLLRKRSFLRVTKKYGHFPYLIETL